MLRLRQHPSGSSIQVQSYRAATTVHEEPRIPRPKTMGNGPTWTAQGPGLASLYVHLVRPDCGAKRQPYLWISLTNSRFSYMSVTIQIMRLGEAARTAPITQSQIERLESELTGIYNRYKEGRMGTSPCISTRSTHILNFDRHCS
jgi:hypothetical protein